MLNFCKVEKCRFSHSHTTISHKCGICGKYGHGERECNNLLKINNLHKYLHETLEISNQCKIAGCKYSLYHSINAHHCSKCNKREHSSRTCPLLINNNKIYNVICPTCRCNNIFPKNNIQVYGIDNNCVICLHKNVEIFFPSCGHVCVCIDCCNELNVIINEEILTKNYNIEYIESKFIESNYPSYKIFRSSDVNIQDDIVIRKINFDSPFEGFKLNNNLDWMLNDFIKGYIEILD